MTTTTTMMAALRQAYDQGYRRGYRNGLYDGQYEAGQGSDDPGESFDFWWSEEGGADAPSIAGLLSMREQLLSIRAELYEAKALVWAVDQDGAYLGIPAPELPQGWEVEDDRFRRLYGAVGDDVPCVAAVVICDAVTHEGALWAWLLEEDAGQGDWGDAELDPDYPPDAPVGEDGFTSLAECLAAAERWAEARMRWWEWQQAALDLESENWKVVDGQ